MAWLQLVAADLPTPTPGPLLVSSQRLGQVQLLGASLHPADAGRVVTVPVTTYLHHVHVTGVTVAGKSTLLAGFARDLAAGHCLLILEPAVTWCITY